MSHWLLKMLIRNNDAVFFLLPNSNQFRFIVDMEGSYAVSIYLLIAWSTYKCLSIGSYIKN